MQFNTYFRLTSYATIAAAALALYVAGGVGPWLVGVFALATIVSFKLEDSRWQLSERIALAVILVSIPFFYLDWQVLTPYLDIEYLETGRRGNVEVAVLSHLILFLSAVKLFQRKHDRDWFFLYLISFFTVLLAAGLTASPMFLAVLIVYLLCALSTVVAFEIQKGRKKVTVTQTRLLVPPDSKLFQKLPMRLWRRRYLETRRLPLVSIGLLVLIVLLALPFFLIAPRTASSALRRGGDGVSGFVGFSDSVTLGQIGQLKRNDEVFMRVRIDEVGSVPPARLRWRGVALDSFTGKAWKKSAVAERQNKQESDTGLFRIGTTPSLAQLTLQSFFMEPVDTPILFGAPRVVAVRGNLPFLRIDSEGAVQTRPHDQERLVYRVYSDTTEPSATALRSDRLQYLVESARYLELPASLDPRVRTLARDVIQQSEARTWYDAAQAVESHLRDKYGYSLEMKAGGADPLADFLFNVKQGHCEYFATAMAVMLRTQGVATRLVNGFLPGEYNDASGAFTVRQSDAHSWVEVYFPETNSWVTFDPTPPAGRAATTRTGFAGMLSKYSEALDLMWFQYVVGYDKQEQRSLVTSARNKLFDLQRGSVNKFAQARAAFPVLIGPILLGATSLFGLIAAVLLTRRVRRFGWSRGLKVWQGRDESEATRVDFYEQLLRALEKQGIKRELYQTPFEFAALVGTDEIKTITRAYNIVRFGKGTLSDKEAADIATYLQELTKNS